MKIIQLFTHSTGMKIPPAIALPAVHAVSIIQTTMTERRLG